jgi:hypothetical protein
VDGQSKLAAPGQKFQPQYAAFRHFGQKKYFVVKFQQLFGCLAVWLFWLL